MNTENFQDIVSEDEMLREIKESEPVSPFEKAPDFTKNIWDGEKLVTEEEYKASLMKEQ